MAETEARRRDWFAPLMTLATVVVAGWSLYYSGVQADAARKTFEMTCNEAHAGLQKDIADLQKQLAAGSTDRNLADLLGRLADVQAQLAEQQRRVTISGGGTLADVQQQMAEVQQAVARLKKEQEYKDQEIASLRASLTTSQKPRLFTLPLTGNNSTPLSSLLKDSLLLSSKHGVPGTGNLLLTPAPQTVDDSVSGRVKTTLLDIWSIFYKYPGPSIYFVLAALMALSKLGARK